jgi:hypothetical protein
MWRHLLLVALTVAQKETCRLQRRSLYGYLSELLAAKAGGDPPGARLSHRDDRAVDAQTDEPFAAKTTKEPLFALKESAFTT